MNKQENRFEQMIEARGEGKTRKQTIRMILKPFTEKQFYNMTEEQQEIILNTA